LWLLNDVFETFIHEGLHFSHAKEENMVFENKVLEIFGPKKNKVTKG